MAVLDELAPNYRRAQRRWPGAPSLDAYYKALATNFPGNGFGLVEHVKSFIESVCLTIMGEFRQPMPSSAPSTTELLVAALHPMGLQNSRGSTKLDLVLSGFNKLADGLTAVRNEVGAVAHGKDGFLDAIAADHARAFLHAGDAILGILLNALEGKQPDLIATREPYESFPHLNKLIDRAVAVEARIDEDENRPIVVFSVATGPRGEAIELRVEPSRLLYGVDREAYVEILKTTELAVAEEEGADKPDAEAGEQAIGRVRSPVVALPEGAVTELVAEYKGGLSVLRGSVEAFLHAQGIDPAVPGGDDALIIDSLLATAEQNFALDWKRRDTVQSKLKIAFKRVLVRFGCEADKAAAVAERFVRWLQVQAPDAASAPPKPTGSEQGTQE